MTIAVNWEVKTCTDSKSFVRGGPLLTFFLVVEGREVQNTTTFVQAGHHQSTSETPLKWGFPDMPMMVQH